MNLVDPRSGTHIFQCLCHSLVFIILCTSPGEKLLVHKADRSRPSSCEVMNESSYTSTPLCAFMVCRTGTSLLWQWTEDFRNRAVWNIEVGEELCPAHGWKHLYGSRTALFSVITQWQFVTDVLGQTIGPILSVQESKGMVSTKFVLI